MIPRPTSPWSWSADITLVTIYDKSDQESISNKELRQLMKKNGLE